MSLSLTLYLYDPVAGVDQHRFTNNIDLPVGLRLPFGAEQLEAPIRQAAEAFHSDWGCVYIPTCSGRQSVTQDAYGKPLTHIRANVLAEILETTEVDDGLTYSLYSHFDVAERIAWLGAIRGFVSCLQPKTPIVLYWH